MLGLIRSVLGALPDDPAAFSYLGSAGPKRILRKQRPDSPPSRRHSHLYHYVGLSHPLGAPALLPEG